jgi:hypothetical protein
MQQTAITPSTVLAPSGSTVLQQAAALQEHAGRALQRQGSLHAQQRQLQQLQQEIDAMDNESDEEQGQGQGQGEGEEQGEHKRPAAPPGSEARPAKQQRGDR